MRKDLSIWLKSGSTQEMGNVKLPQGEFGYDTDKNELKIGDGNTLFNNLPELSGGGLNLYLGAPYMTTISQSRDQKQCFFNCESNDRLWGFKINEQIWDIDNLKCYNVQFYNSQYDYWYGISNTSPSYLTISTSVFIGDFLIGYSSYYHGFELYFNENNQSGVDVPVVITPIFYNVDDIKIGEKNNNNNNNNNDSEYGYGY